MKTGKIYIDQSNLAIIANTDVVIINSLSTIIKYIKPDGTSGQFEAEITGEKQLTYEFSEPSELDQIGIWVFWVFVVFSDGRKAPGEPVIERVYKQGT